jgi:hypothetical protein
MNKTLKLAFSSLCVVTLATGALASTASQREYKRGYADCAAGRWDENQHGASYKEGCRAAEDKRDAGAGAGAATEPSKAAPEEKPYIDAAVPGRDRQACIKAVKSKTHNPKVVVIGAVSSEAANTVTLGVGPDRAPWRCLVKRGKVSDVMSQTNEGAM